MDSVDIQGALDDFIHRVAAGIVSASKDAAPQATGNLKKDIKIIKEGGGRALIGNTRIAPYARFVHEGTKAHKIEPKSKKALKTPYGIFRSVNHPGTRANPYFIRAAEKFLRASEYRNAQEEFLRRVGEEIEGVFKGDI